jgi:hypothetical protein
VDCAIKAADAAATENTTQRILLFKGASKTNQEIEPRSEVNLFFGLKCPHHEETPLLDDPATPPSVDALPKRSIESGLVIPLELPLS